MVWSSRTDSRLLNCSELAEMNALCFLLLCAGVGTSISGTVKQSNGTCPTPGPKPDIFASHTCNQSNNGQLARCITPNILGGSGFNGSRNLGIFYNYLITEANGVAPVNRYYDLNGIKTTTYAQSGVQSLDVFNSVFQYNNATDTKCHGTYLYGDWFSNGRRNYIQYTSDASTIRYNQFFTLYWDYETLEITYMCMNSDPATDYCINACAQPLFYANTRKRPDTMSAAELNRIDNIVNLTLAPFCITTANLTKTIWNNQPLCSIPSPSCLTTFFQSVEGTTPPANKF